MKTTHFRPILDSSVKKLVAELESGSLISAEERDLKLQELIILLKNNCENEEVKKRYASYRKNRGSSEVDLNSFEYYPVDSDGFAQAFDPLENEEDFWNCWFKFGVIVGARAVSSSLCKSTIERFKQIISDLSHGRVSVEARETYASVPVDSNGTALMSRGFLEIYHDDSLAQLRQALRVYLHHVVIWGRSDLWTSFDRIGIKLPGHTESKALPLHVDQNPTVHPGFQTVQGVLALADCPVERGTFVAVPSSQRVFHHYGQIVRSREDNYRGEYVELNKETEFGTELQKRTQSFALREGNLITFDSRTTHANSANISDQARIVAYIAQGPAPTVGSELLSVRKEAFETGLGSNVRDILLHASMRPRFTDEGEVNRVRKPEELTYLGKLLYGIE